MSSFPLFQPSHSVTQMLLQECFLGFLPNDKESTQVKVIPLLCTVHLSTNIQKESTVQQPVLCYINVVIWKNRGTVPNLVKQSVKGTFAIRNIKHHMTTWWVVWCQENWYFSVIMYKEDTSENQTYSRVENHCTRYMYCWPLVQMTPQWRHIWIMMLSQ